MVRIVYVLIDLQIVEKSNFKSNPVCLQSMQYWGVEQVLYQEFFLKGVCLYCIFLHVWWVRGDMP